MKRSPSKETNKGVEPAIGGKVQALRTRDDFLGGLAVRGRKRNAISREIRTLRRSLRALDRSLLRLRTMLSAGMAQNTQTKGNSRSRLRLSAKGRAALVLQGRYIGYMRHLKPLQKAQVRKIREAKGVRAAIARARRRAIG